jgi:glyoxylase-like metal-dependent hydrolase (beta-lactamase superfamily II)
MVFSRRLALVVSAVVFGASAAVLAQRDFSKVEIQSQQLAPGLHMLIGAGGNIGVCAGADGVFLVDDQYAPLTDKIRAAVTKISDKPIRFVLNTHWHGDHVGGNENMAAAGALLVAQDNVRRRMRTGQTVGERKVEPAALAALPVVTFDDTVTFHLNGDDIVAYHVPHAHTDGDAIIVFGAANVVHLGDCFFNGIYPRIDVASGGSIDGMIAATEGVLGRIGPETRLIPGHGPLGDRAALVAYRDMLVGVRNRVRELAAAGKSLQEIQAAKPTAAYDAQWGNGFIKPDVFVEFVYAGVKG